MPKLKHVVGSRFGRLVILSRVGVDITCRCDCGNVTVVNLANLCSFHTTSCGCLRKEVTIARSTRHGYAKRGKRDRAYQCWIGIRKRCLNPNSRDWSNYGGRGITISKRWRDSFEAFLIDMGEPPLGRSIERKNNNGPYSKRNCVWATRAQQNSNTRKSHFLILRGERHTLAEWARILHLSGSTIHRRLNRGLSVARVLSTKVVA